MGENEEAIQKELITLVDGIGVEPLRDLLNISVFLSKFGSVAALEDIEEDIIAKLVDYVGSTSTSVCCAALQISAKLLLLIPSSSKIILETVVKHVKLMRSPDILPYFMTVLCIGIRDKTFGVYLCQNTKVIDILCMSLKPAIRVNRALECITEFICYLLPFVIDSEYPRIYAFVREILEVKPYPAGFHILRVLIDEGLFYEDLFEFVNSMIERSGSNRSVCTEVIAVWNSLLRHLESNEPLKLALEQMLFLNEDDKLPLSPALFFLSNVAVKRETAKVLFHSQLFRDLLGPIGNYNLRQKELSFFVFGNLTMHFAEEMFDVGIHPSIALGMASFLPTAIAPSYYELFMGVIESIMQYPDKAELIKTESVHDALGIVAEWREELRGRAIELAEFFG